MADALAGAGRGAGVRSSRSVDGRANTDHCEVRIWGLTGVRTALLTRDRCGAAPAGICGGGGFTAAGLQPVGWRGLRLRARAAVPAWRLACGVRGRGARIDSKQSTVG